MIKEYCDRWSGMKWSGLLCGVEWSVWRSNGDRRKMRKRKDEKEDKEKR